MSLLVVGSVAYDTVETASGRADDVLGGSATFFSVSASRFVPTRVVAVVGEDFRDDDIELLRSHGVDLTGLHREPGKTFRWGGRYAEDGINRETLFTHLNVFEHFRPELPQSYRDSDYVLLANIEPSLQLGVLDQVESPKAVGLDTMDLWIKTRRDVLEEVIRRVDILFVNDAEATELTGERLMRTAGRKLQEMGPKNVVIKRGEHGALLFAGDEIFYSPALPLATVNDPTGAGDTFAGGFLGWVAHCGSTEPAVLRQAVAVGTVMASFAVEEFSLNRLRAVQSHEITERLGELAEMTRFDPPSL